MTVQWSARSFRDTLVNLMSGLGVPGRDKAASGSAQFIYSPLTQMEIEAAYRTNWLARKLVDIPAQDATRAWRAWQCDANEIEALEDQEQTLNIANVLKNALIMSRLYGGSALILGVDQGKANEPLILEEVGKGDLKFVVAVSRYTLGHGPIMRDVMDPLYGRPEYFVRSGAQIMANPVEDFRIHPSRVIMLRGMSLPDPITIGEVWGDSVLQVVLDAVMAATGVAQSIATLVSEAKVDVIHVPDLAQNLATQEYANQLTARFAYANVAKSVVNTLLLDKEEEWERVTANFTTLPDILQMYLVIVSGAADIPATRMLGQSPSGLNATGDADLRNYYDHVNSDQTAILSPALATLDDVLIRSALGDRDPSLYYIWNPLWQLSEEDKAKVAQMKAATFKLDVDAGLVDQEALRIGRQNQLIEDGVYPGLEQALEEQEQLDLESMVSVEEQQAQAEAQMQAEMQANQIGAAAGGGAPPGGGGKPQPPKKKSLSRKPSKDEALSPWIAHDRNPDPLWVKGEAGLFAGSKPGVGHPEARYKHEQSLYKPGDVPKYLDLRARALHISHTALKSLRRPRSPLLKEKMRELRGVMREIEKLHADPGTLAGLKRPGGPIDVLFIGGGPAGMGGAINAATEGFDTMVLEASMSTGGQSKKSSRVENYPGYTWGVAGDELAQDMAYQAEKSGAKLKLGTKVVGLTYDHKTGLKTVHLENGKTVIARVVVISGGVQFKKMTFPGHDGPGVSYADGKQMTKDAGRGVSVVIGGSNGAAQAALGATLKNQRIYVVSRSAVEKGMSEYQAVSVKNEREISVVEGDEIESLVRDARGRPSEVILKSGKHIACNAVGLFIGSAPDTKWVPKELRNADGFIYTDDEYRTAMPGVFAAGDIRAKGPMRILTSASEGQMATKFATEYFAKQKDDIENHVANPHEHAWKRNIVLSLEAYEAEQAQHAAEHAELLQLRAREAARAKLDGFESDYGFEDEQSSWDEIVNRLYALDMEHPYLIQMIEEDDQGAIINAFAEAEGTAQKKKTHDLAHPDFDPNERRRARGHEGGGQWTKTEGPAAQRAKGLHEPKPPPQWEREEEEESEAFVSPNVGNLTFAQAKLSFNSPRQQALLKANKEIDKLLGIKAEQTNVIGAWSDGAENSVMIVMHGVTPKQARASAAMKGYLADQKAVLVFTPNPEEGKGEHDLVSFTLNESADASHDRLTKAGVIFHTLEMVGDNQTRVHVLVQDEATDAAVDGVASEHGTELRYREGTGEFIPGSNVKGSGRQQRDAARVSYEEVARSSLGKGDYEAWGELRDRWRREFEALPLQGLAEGSDPHVISPSFTKTNRADLDHEEVYIHTGMDQMSGGTEEGSTNPAFAFNIGIHRDIPAYLGMRADELVGDDRTVGRRIINRMKNNVRFWWDHVTEAQMAALEWYRAAHKMIEAKAKLYGLNVAAVAGAFAAISPHKDWDQNVYISNQIVDIWGTKQDFQWSNEMSMTAAHLWEDEDSHIAENIHNKKLSELTADKDIAVWIRTYAETYGDPEQALEEHAMLPNDVQAPWLQGIQHQQHYRYFSADLTKPGAWAFNKDGVTKTPVTWSTTDQLTNAVHALRSNGDRHAISDAMGEKHKVRNFYNNLVDPDGRNGDVTIDSHAMGAAWLRPSPQSAISHGLASGPAKGKKPAGFKGAHNNAGLGAYGTYGLYADAYREVAAELGILPDQLQAVIWVAKRDMMVDMFDDSIAKIDAIWEEFHDGEVTLEEAQEEVWEVCVGDRAEHKELVQSGLSRDQLKRRKQIEATGLTRQEFMARERADIKASGLSAKEWHAQEETRKAGEAEQSRLIARESKRAEERGVIH